MGGGGKCPPFHGPWAYPYLSNRFSAEPETILENKVLQKWINQKTLLVKVEQNLYSSLTVRPEIAILNGLYRVTQLYAIYGIEV